MRPSTWITVVKRASVWAACLSLPLTAAYAQERGAQPAPAPVTPAAQPAKPEAHKPQAAKPAAAASGAAPAAHSGTPAPAAQPAQPEPTAAGKPAKAKQNKAQAKTAKTKAAQPVAPAPVIAPAPAQPAPEQLAQVQPPLRLKSSDTPPPSAAGTGPICSLAEPEQPRGGRLDVLGDRFGSAPVVRIAGKPARMLERRADRLSVQIPADSDGGAITLQNDGKALACGNLVIIGKNR